MNKSLFFILVSAILAFSVACDTDSPEPDNPTIDRYEDGIFITCEGGFGSGNATVFFIDPRQGLFAPDIYLDANGEMPGDVLNSATFRNGKTYLVMNNSGNILVVDQPTFEKEGSIEGLSAPTELQIDGSTGYIGNLFSEYIITADMGSLEISDSLHIGVSSEKIQLDGDQLYILSQSEYMGRVKDHIYFLDLNSHEVDSVEVGFNPIDWAYDGTSHLYVYCQGKENGEGAGIYSVNTSSGEVEFEEKLEKGGFFGLITYDLYNDRILFSQEGGIYSYNPASQTMDSNPVIPFNEIEMLYGLDTDPLSGDIYTGDARDFTQSGVVRIYSENGQLGAMLETGVGPNHFYFN